MASLGLVGLSTSVFDFHIHVNGPDIHAFGVVGDNTLEHGAAVLRAPILVLEHAKLRDHVDMTGFWQGLQAALQDCLGFREALILVLAFFTAHFEKELDVARPDFEALVVLLAELLVDIFHKVHLVARPVDIDQLQVDLLAVVHFQGPLNHVLKLLG